MKYCCDWCGETFDTHIDGVIKMLEHAPIQECAMMRIILSVRTNV